MRRRVVEMNDYESEALLLLDVVQALVDNPEAAIVKSRPMSDSEGVVLTIHCAEAEGKLSKRFAFCSRPSRRCMTGK